MNLAYLSHQAYDALERAIRVGQRIVVWRAGIEYVLIPTELKLQSGREVIATRRPTGDSLMLYLDEIDSLEVIS